MNRDRTDSRSIKKVLLVGLGPAAAQIAVLLTNAGVTYIDILTRTSYQSKEISATTSKIGYSSLNGIATIRNIETDFSRLEGDWDTVIYCTPNDVYEDITIKLMECENRYLERILLLSPGIGDHALVQGIVSDRAVVLSLSTYFAATKWTESNTLNCLTKNIKKKVYIGSTKGLGCPSVMEFAQLLTNAGVQVEVTDTALMAESRNITTFVHPPFFMNPFALEEIFFGTGPIKSMYKVYPEGPLTPAVMKEMVLLWKEIMNLLRVLDVPPLDLLRFLNDDNYPVPEYLLSRETIDGFMKMAQKEQEYALYIRYTGLLIDPFSTPDEDGYYLDFSRVPLKRVFQQEDSWIIPRIPLEDYRKIKRLVFLGEILGINLSVAKKLTDEFEAFVKRAETLNRATINVSALSKKLQQEAKIIGQQLHLKESGVQ